jgi:hypothetical protein
VNDIKRKQNSQLPGPSFRARSCTGKKKYRSELEAMDALDIQKEYGADVRDVRPYRCGFCGKWHLGHEMEG